jgi:hypothetical protein
MKPFKPDTFNERLSSAAASKAALLEKFRSRPTPHSPEMLERREQLKAVAAARDVRNAEKWAARAAEAARIAAEERARKAEEAARIAAERAAAAALAREQKAARDARYAARKTRKR